MTVLDRVSALLDARGVPHALIGAAALAAAGVARSTFDVDLLVVDDSVLRDDFWDGFRAAGVAVDVRRGDADDPLGGVVRLDLPSDRPVDIIVGKHPWQARALERSHRPPEGPPVVVPRDLVLLKLYAGGSQDLWDVRELLRLPESGTLAGEVEADLETLPGPMRNRWTSARRA